MKTNISSLFRRLICGVEIINLSISVPITGSIALNPPPTAEPSECPTDNIAIHVTSNPPTIVYGQSIVVSWSVDIPSECVQTSVRLDGRVVAQRGSLKVAPSRNTRYTITVFHKGAQAKTKSTQVNVDYPSHVVIDQNTVDPVGVLIGALQSSTNPEQTVALCNVDLDLTGYTNIFIRDNRSLIALPACERGPRNLGPRIFVTDKRGKEPLFLVYGDNVTISGFRLEGPSRRIERDNDNNEFGIYISPSDGQNPVQSIEISNMEISQWSGAGIYVTDTQRPNERGRLFNTNIETIRIKNNYIHHNRHTGEGYGVEITGGAYALIEQNVFEENRHAIAGGSRPKDNYDYSGYTARDNLILSGGGVACWTFSCWQTHQIDMHGDDNRFYSGHNKQCGMAGETIVIERNTILYTNGLAIKIRGNPTDKAVVDGNVFAHENRSDAIDQNGECGYGDNISNPIDVRTNNVFGANPMAELGSCDFYGDGQLDQFMATGVTWWAKSPITHQWRYLNTMPELLSQLQLGKIDSDTVCDVASRTSSLVVLPKKYSKSGMEPWVPVLDDIRP